MSDPCPRCGDAKGNLRKHYILPLEEGGLDADENIIFLCSHCQDIANLVKLHTRNDIIEWNTTYVNAVARMMKPWYRKVYGSAKS